MLENKSPERAISDGRITRFKDRLRIAINGESNVSFADRCGMSERVIRDYLRGKTYPSLDRLSIIAEASGKSLEWLAAGVEDSNNHNSLCIKDSNFVHVPQLNISVAAGHGINPTTEIKIGEFIFAKDWIYKEGLSNANLATIHVTGDSMEATINDGDIALVNVKEEGWGCALDGVFVILHNDHLLVKRLQYDMIENGVYVISDNASYRSFFIKFDEGTSFKVIAKVERILTKMRQIK